MTLHPESLTVVECEAIIAEARLALRGQAWQVPRRSTTAAVLAAHGLPASDAQVVHYGVGEGYAWHTDGDRRSLTYAIQLSNPEDYRGGLLEVMAPAGWFYPSVVQGSITTFPASWEHRVNEVTRGERFALAAWEPA